MRNIPNQDTLAAALQLVEEAVAVGKYPFINLEAFREDWTFGGVAYDTNRTRTYEMATGKPRAKRWLTLSISRLSSGRYETVAYIS